VQSLSAHRETTIPRGVAPDDALFRRLENFFRARRAALHAQKISASA